MMNYIFYLALASAIAGTLMYLSNKTSVSIVKNCPCKKIVQSGLAAKYFTYFGCFCLMYSCIFIGFDLYKWQLFAILGLAVILLFFSFALKE